MKNDIGQDISTTALSIIILLTLGLIAGVRRDQPSEQLRLKTIVGTAPKCRVSIDLLDARSAMLHDLRAVISEMDNYLLELIQYLRSVKV